MGVTDTRTFVGQIGLLVFISGVLLNLFTNPVPVMRNAYPPYRTSEKLLRNTTNTLHAGGRRDVGNSTPACYRQVQFWNGPATHQRPVVQQCPELRCGIRRVEDRSFETMRESDAVVLFHRAAWDWKEMHRRRPSGQKWLFYTQESPIHTRKRIIPPAPYYNNSYDYTLNYRINSSITISYGYYDPTEPVTKGSMPRNWAKEKSRLITWMASNCGTTSWRRTAFVRTLSKHVPVDMYGACGNMQCSRKEGCSSTLKMYKFYLALENSECRDYITEKFWRNALLNGIVPVVYGTVKEDYERVAPPNSFIHLQDFASLTEFIEYLHKVDANDTLYNSYHEWRRHGSIQFKWDDPILTLNDLCKVVAKLLEDEDAVAAGKNTTSRVPDLNSWWTGSCFNPSGFPRNVV